MEKPALPFRNLGLSAVALCLAATFGLSVSTVQSADRVNRQQQRSRVQRHPRQRVCPGISQEPCALQAAFVKAFKFAADPPEEPVTASRPVLSFLELTVLPVRRLPQPAPVHTPSLPRPPPSLA